MNVAHATRTLRKPDESIPFISTCPACTQVRPQCGYDRGSLHRLLNGGHVVEAYCETCDQYWPISSNERVRLAVAVIAPRAKADS